MKFVKFILCAGFAFVLAGCLGVEQNLQVEKNKIIPSWTKYLENDESIKEIAFYSQNLAATKELKDGSNIGFALTKKSINSEVVNVKITDMFVSNGVSFGITDLDRGGYYINMHDKNEILSLKNSKNIKFYQFGGGILETIIYSSNLAVCDSFWGQKAIHARAVTNYYDPRTPDNSRFFATITEAKLIKDGDIKRLKSDFKYFLGDDVNNFKEVAKSEKFADVISKDFNKQQRVLQNIICAEFKR